MNEIEKAISAIGTALAQEPPAAIEQGYGFYLVIEDALAAALAALREQAEMEKGCEFCCYQEYHDKTLYPKEGYVFYAGFSKQIDVDDFDEIETDEIKYCPMCGKRLEEHHEAD